MPTGPPGRLTINHALPRPSHQAPVLYPAPFLLLRSRDRLPTFQMTDLLVLLIAFLTPVAEMQAPRGQDLRLLCSLP